MKTRVAAAAVLVLALSIISTTFTLLAATSKSWATQVYYSDKNQTELGLTETTPACILDRSPFYRCGPVKVNISGHCEISDCAFYKPYGRNQTSCRSATEYNTTWLDDASAQGLLGMSQECQEGRQISHIFVRSEVR